MAFDLTKIVLPRPRLEESVPVINKQNEQVRILTKKRRKNFICSDLDPILGVCSLFSKRALIQNQQWQSPISGFYYKHVTIVIYNRNDSGLCYDSSRIVLSLSFLGLSLYGCKGLLQIEA